MVIPVGKLSIEVSHYPKPGGARVARGWKRRPLENGADGRTALHGCYDVMRQKELITGAVTTKSTYN